MTTTKILIAGDVKGRLDACFARVSTVNANHGPFSCLLCVGDFLGEAESAGAALAPYKAGEQKAPLPTYFLGAPDGMVPPELLVSTTSGGEVAPQITCLGAAGIHVLSGLKVAFISGAQTNAAQLPPDGVAELKRLSELPGFTGVDIFLTNQWPRGFFKKLPDGTLPVDLLPDSDLPTVGTEAVAELACALQPRYHVCGSEGQYWQRPAYRQGGGAVHVCRLVGLAGVQSDTKGRNKWLHALSLIPMGMMAPATLAQVTEVAARSGHLVRLTETRRRATSRRQWISSAASLCGRSAARFPFPGTGAIRRNRVPVPVCAPTQARGQRQWRRRRTRAEAAAARVLQGHAELGSGELLVLHVVAQVRDTPGREHWRGEVPKSTPCDRIGLPSVHVTP